VIVFGPAERGARWAFGDPRPDELDPTVLVRWSPRCRSSTRCGEGVIELPAAARDGLVVLHGRRDLLLRLPDALRLPPVAPCVRRGRSTSVPTSVPMSVPTTGR
jgi:hypothetical protein